MNDLQRNIRQRLQVESPKTEAALAKEFGVSKAAVREAASAEENIIVVPDCEERSYEYCPGMRTFVEKNQEASNG